MENLNDFILISLLRNIMLSGLKTELTTDIIFLEFNTLLLADGANIKLTVQGIALICH